MKHHTPPADIKLGSRSSSSSHCSVENPLSHCSCALGLGDDDLRAVAVAITLIQVVPAKRNSSLLTRMADQVNDFSHNCCCKKTVSCTSAIDGCNHQAGLSRQAFGPYNPSEISQHLSKRRERHRTMNSVTFTLENELLNVLDY